MSIEYSFKHSYFFGGANVVKRSPLCFPVILAPHMSSFFINKKTRHMSIFYGLFSVNKFQIITLRNFNDLNRN